MTEQELENRFGFHPATDETKGMHEHIRKAFLELALEISDMLPDSREKSLFVTALEESSMWANAAVARNLAPLEQ